MRTFIDFFMYSEGNVKALLICCCISLTSFVLFILSLFFGNQKKKNHAVGWNACPNCGKENESGMSFCRHCGAKL